jgi:hypothetical protein
MTLDPISQASRNYSNTIPLEPKWLRSIIDEDAHVGVGVKGERDDALNKIAWCV